MLTPMECKARKTMAQLNGEKRYESNPCPKGHLYKYTSNGRCITCHSQYERRKRLKEEAEIGDI
jgi:hypothetical protein